MIIEADLPLNLRVALMVLYRYCGDRDGGRCWKTQKALAKICCWKVRHLRDTLSRLAGMGILLRIRPDKTTRNQYEIDWRVLSMVPRMKVKTDPVTSDNQRQCSASGTGNVAPIL